MRVTHIFESWIMTQKDWRRIQGGKNFWKQIKVRRDGLHNTKIKRNHRHTKRINKGIIPHKIEESNIIRMTTRRQPKVRWDSLKCKEKGSAMEVLERQELWTYKKVERFEEHPDLATVAIEEVMYNLCTKWKWIDYNIVSTDVTVQYRSSVQTEADRS